MSSNFLLSMLQIHVMLVTPLRFAFWLEHLMYSTVVRVCIHTCNVRAATSLSHPYMFSKMLQYLNVNILVAAVCVCAPARASTHTHMLAFVFVA